MSRCPNHCCTCQSKVNAEQKASFKEVTSICLCHTGLMPSSNIVIKDISDLVLDKNDKDDKPYISDDALEEGD